MARLQPKTGAVKSFGTREGFTLADVTSVTVTENGDVFAVGDSCKLLRLPANGSTWQEVSTSGAGAMSYGTGDPLRLCAQADQLLLVAAALILREPASNGWTNFGKFQPRVHDVAADATRIWVAEDRGLTLFDGAQHRIESWRADEGLGWPVPDSLTNPRMALLRESGGYSFWRDGHMSREESAEGRLLHAFRQFAQSRVRALERRRERAGTTGSFESPSRLPGGVTALAHDGEFLLLGLAHPAIVMLYHKPSDSFIGHVKLTDSVRSLAASRDHLWFGFGYHETLLMRMEKRELMSAPKARWLPNRISADELDRAVSRLPIRQQALNAFFAGDHARTLEVLDREGASRADLEALFLRAFCHDFWGLNNPGACRRAFDDIIARCPDSPWEKAARAAFAASEEARGALNEPPKTPEELAQEERRAEKEFDEKIESVFQRSDTDNDQRLNPIEAGLFWNVLALYFHGGNALGYKRHLYDTNSDSYLDKSEFQAVLEKLRQEKAAAARSTR